MHKAPVYENFGKPLLTSVDSSNPWWALLEGAVKKANGVLICYGLDADIDAQMSFFYIFRVRLRNHRSFPRPQMLVISEIEAFQQLVFHQWRTLYFYFMITMIACSHAGKSRSFVKANGKLGKPKIFPGATNARYF
ncbi:N-acyl-aliphatic-L-amino acid amidohydrolase [Sarracenia purpurea var. burkii]